MRRKKQASINAAIARNGDTSYDEAILEQVETLKSENSQLLSRVDSLENQVKQLIVRFDQSPKDFEAVQSRVSKLETSSGRHTADLNTLQTWKNAVNSFNEPKAAASSKSDISEAVKSFVLEAVDAKDDAVKEILREELNNMDVSMRLYVDETAENTKKTMEKKVDNTDKKAEKDHKDVVTLTTGFNAIEKQVRDLIMYIGPIQEYFMLNRITLLDRIKQHAGKIGQVQRCQSEHEKLSKEQTRICHALDELFTKDKVTSIKMAAINDGLVAKIESLSNKLSNITTITQQLAQVKADVLTLRNPVASSQALSPLVDSLKSRLEDLEKDSENLRALENQVAELSETITAVKDRRAQPATDADLIAKVVEEHLQASTQLLSSRLEAGMLGASTQSYQRNSDDNAQNIWPDAKALGILKQELEEQVEDHLEPVQLTVHNLSNELAVLQHSLPELLKQALDPLRLSVGQDIQQLRADLTTFQQQTSSASSVTQLDSILEDVKGVKTELENFQQSRTNESSLREREILGLKKELALKADLVTFDGMLNNLRCSLRSLQDQYNNISTETLHQKMVHWFLKNYPSSQANLVLQVTAMQHEVHGLQDLASQLAWLPSKSQDLNALLTCAPQLQALADSADSLHRLVQPRSRIDQACEEAQEAVKIVRTVEKTLNEKTEFLQSALKTDIEDIQKWRAEIDTRVNALESTSPALRQDIDRIRTDFVEPNKEALAMYGQLVLTLGQVQETVRAICQNLPTVNGRNPALDIAFSYDLSAKPTGSKRDGTNSTSRS